MFELALDAKQEAALVEEISGIAAAVETNADLAAALSNPLISRDDKAAILTKLAAKGSALTQQSLATLAAHGRATILPVLAELLQAKLAAHRNVAVAEVTSARALSAEVQAQVRAALEKATGKPVQLTLKENPELLGGLQVRLGSYLLDASLAGALSNMRADLLATSSI